jgi:hypothetical protein
MIDHVRPVGMTPDGNPRMELGLTVRIPGRVAYATRHTQVVSRLVMHNLEPGRSVPVRVDPRTPERLELG